MRIRIIKVILPLLLMLSLLVPSSAYAAPDIPEFGGAAAIELSGFVPAFSPDDFTGEDYIRYSELDALGRPGPATACFSSASHPAELRAESGAYLPVGWESVRYDDVIDGGYLYSVCQLISPALSGSGPDARNVFTGTRFLRAEGLRPFEDLVAGFVSRTAYHILYRATPVYHGDELVPYGVQLEAYSAEDAGRTISLNVFLYNVQPGVTIDYRSGKSAQSPSVEVTSATGDILHLHQYQTRPGPDAPAVGSFSELGSFQQRSYQTTLSSRNGKQYNFIINKNTHTIHTTLCKNPPNEENRIYFTGTVEQLRNAYPEHTMYEKWCSNCPAPTTGSFAVLNDRDNKNTTAKTSAYILNTQTKIYHTGDCGHLPPAEYRRDFTGTPHELLEMGYYDRCDFCQAIAAEKEKEKKASSPAGSAAGSTSQSTPASTTEKETAQSAKKSLFDLPESAIDKMAGSNLTDNLRYDDSVYEQAVYGTENDDW